MKYYQDNVEPTLCRQYRRSVTDLVGLLPGKAQDEAWEEWQISTRYKASVRAPLLPPSAVFTHVLFLILSR